ncbi:MAG: 3-phosphoshikimate 1-carboxyvinyltransferase [Candidatus Hadarchaeales archaeon]
MNLTIEKSELSDSIEAFPSKFFTQMACAVAIVSGRKNIIKNPTVSKETTLMLKATEGLGGEVRRSGEKWIIFSPQEILPASGSINVKNSGSAAALLAGVLSAAKTPVLLTGGQSLCARPMAPLLESLQTIGVDIHSIKETDSPPFIIFSGSRAGGQVKLSGEGSKYFGVMALVSPMTANGVKIYVPPIATQIKPALELMEVAGVKARRKKSVVEIPPKNYRSLIYEVPPDISFSAPFFISQVLCGREVKIRARVKLPRDRIFLSLLEKFGIGWEMKRTGVRVWGGKLKGAKVDVSSAPELFPIFALIACLAKGRSVINGAGGARKMKSDRISVMTVGLKKMGAQILEEPDGIIAQGPSELHGASVECSGDPAIAAALMVAGMMADGKTSIVDGLDALNLSYSKVITTLKELGAKTGL